MPAVPAFDPIDVGAHRKAGYAFYQKGLFDRRADAYIELLSEASLVTDELALYWAGEQERGWKKRLTVTSLVRKSILIKCSSAFVE